MSKKDKNQRQSQYDDYEEEERSHRKKVKLKKKQDIELDYLFDCDPQKKRATDRYHNKKKDKNKYDKYDDWN